jgi:protein SCO1/2
VTRAAALLLLALAGAVRADGPAPTLLRDVGLDPRLGAPLPLDLAFRDESGAAVRLRDYVGDGRPVVLSLVYFGCPLLCGETLGGLAASLKTLAFDVGREFRVLVVSFDPRDDPAAARAKKADVVARYGRPGTEDGWRFLTGDAAPIRTLAGAVGFRFAWDEGGRQFAHVPVLIVLTPDGRIARYFTGVEVPPRDLRLGLIEAASRRIGTTVDRLLLYCYRYDATTGRYTALVERALRIGGALTLAGLVALVAVLRRRERRTA